MSGQHDSWSGVPDGEPITGKTYRADGWAYFCTPAWQTREQWNLFLSILGKGNYIILIKSNAKAANGQKMVRGQMIVSPQGLANAAAARGPRQ